MSLEEDLSLAEVIGRGRSGEVSKLVDSEGKVLAGKVFIGDSATKVIHHLISGAPNPYGWNEDAILCAYHRRKILEPLCEYWFNDKLRVAVAHSTPWNEEHDAFELRTEFIDGRHAALKHPFSSKDEVELSDLVNNIMKPLQEILIESGFDGLVWQAGKGNPVAANNFMVEENDGSKNWVWIDLESGVPALIPLNPLTLFSFYIPASIKHRRLLFDDVDIEKLLSYVKSNMDGLVDKIGEERYISIIEDINKLRSHQRNWKSMSRAENGIEYQLRTGKIEQRNADFYREHQYFWYARESARYAWTVYNKVLGELPWNIFERLCLVDYKKLFFDALKFIGSQKFRTKVAKEYVEKRIAEWNERGALSDNEAEQLLGELKSDSASSYITDFFVHIALNGISKSCQFGVLPLLYLHHDVSGETLFNGIMFGGGATRFVYSSGRFVQSAVKGEEKPWIALGMSIMPKVGNLAYPIQMTYSAKKEANSLARFIAYDTVTIMGCKIPIWGGNDTLTEHFFNRIADRFFGN